MATRTRRLGLVWICVVLSLLVGSVVGDAEGEGEHGIGIKNAPLIKEIERLKDLVADLEEASKEKESRLQERDSLLSERDAYIKSVESELQSIKSDNGDPENLSKLESELKAAVLKVKALESNVAEIQSESEEAKNTIELWKKRALAAEESLKDLENKHSEVRKELSEHKKRAQSAEQTLKVAESAMLEAEAKAHARTKELLKVTNQWLPHWASTRVGQIQANAVSKWSKHAKPQVELLLKSASQKAAECQEWAKPHIESVTSKVVPTAQQHWRTVADSISPHVHALRSNTLKGYEVVRTEYVGKAHSFVKPHVDNLVEASRPYVGLVQEHTRPYVDQVATFTKPYLDQARHLASPYVEKAAPLYRDVVSAAVKHHKSLQETVRANLAKHDMGNLVSQELVWFLASALLALPVLTLILALSSAFGAKRQQPKKKGAAGANGQGTKKRSKRDK